MSLDLHTIIDSDGKAPKAKDPNLPAAELQKLYRLMVTTRLMDDRGLALQRQGRIGFYLQSTGQEASHLGTAYALEQSDWLFPAYRQPGILLLREVPIEQIVCEWFGNSGDTSKGRQMPVHYSFRQANFVSISSPIGTHIPQAVGAAYAMKLRGEKHVVLSSFGDGGTSSLGFHSGLNFAGVWKAPVVFLCQNNQWAISCPSSAQTASESYAIKAKAYGMPGVLVDGNDVLAVRKAVFDAVERARKGGGPTLIEAFTFRMSGHSTSDDPTRYVPKEQFVEWEKKDPVLRFEKFLAKKKLWNEDLRAKYTDEATREVNDAVQAAEHTPRPGIETIFSDVYADVPAHIRKQGEAAFDLAARKGDASAGDGKFPL